MQSMKIDADITWFFDGLFSHLFYESDDNKCDSCSAILEELENIDDDTDKHGIQFVKSNDVKLAHEIGIFAFPALVYYETGVPIMYDGKYRPISPSRWVPFLLIWLFINCR